MPPVRRYRLKVEVEPLAEGGYLAICPELQGCHAEGNTIAEALENVEDVARVIIELCQEKGLPLPPEVQEPESQAVVKAEMVVRVGS
ncbi:MAG: type II toxin-antitoxin system HicB family antitoxin [Chloroflexi bacterium]|nr:type II toxin-antitoxin system HicB family antitoxin [Chloroflexota bacterium]